MYDSGVLRPLMVEMPGHPLEFPAFLRKIPLFTFVLRFKVKVFDNGKKLREDGSGPFIHVNLANHSVGSGDEP